MAAATALVTFELPYRETNSGFKALLIYTAVVGVYALLILSSLFFSSVKKWVIENNLKKVEKTPLIIFTICLIVPGAALFTLDKAAPRYIKIESSSNFSGGPETTIGLFHQTEFDGLILSGLDQQDLRLAIGYSNSWSPPASPDSVDVFRWDTLVFKPVGSLSVIGGLPYMTGSYDKHLFAKLKNVKARRIIVREVNNSLSGYSIIFSTLHSVNHFSKERWYDRFVNLNDGGKPNDNNSYPTTQASYQTGLDQVDHLPLKAEDRKALIETFFRKVAEDQYSQYLFTNRKTIKMNGLAFGMYTEFRSMFDNHGPKAIIEIWDKSVDDSFADLLQSISHIRPYEYVAEGTEYELPFKSLNPLFVEWLQRYGMPEGDETFLGFTSKEIYETIFRRMIWMMAASHEFIADGNFDTEAQAYLEKANAASEESPFSAMEYLRDRYSPTLEETTAFTKVNEKFKDEEGYYPFNEYVAIGFWLRRKLDGSDEAVWNLVTDILNNYDNYPYEGGK
ncbi:hypothetical protein WSM22_18940 [Cytophagales bacterium WSM2-2]|nr:hypothetical protein WSM22_18940 [Cytophagales bacterium WSM2-2]